MNHLGLAGLLVLFAIQFAVELVHLFQKAFSLKEVDLILAALNMIDLALIGGLVVMVMLTGYENFVSRIEPAAHADWHLQLTPGSDAALALGLMHVIVRDELIDHDYVARHTLGFAALRRALQGN